MKLRHFFGLTVTFLIIGAFSFADTVTQVKYTLPVPDCLRPYAEFSVDHFVYHEAGTTVFVRYELPALLTGIPQDITFFGHRSSTAQPGDDFALEGSTGSAVCQEIASRLSCNVSLRNLQSDPIALEHLVSRASTSAEEFVRGWKWPKGSALIL